MKQSPKEAETNRETETENTHGNNTETNTEVTMDLAAAIKEARLEQNRSQKDLAEAVGCSRTTIAHYEQGRRAPRPDLLEKIAEELDLDLAALVPDHGDTSEPEEEPEVEEEPDEDAAPTNGRETPEQQAAREAAEARQAEEQKARERQKEAGKRQKEAGEREQRARRAASSGGARQEAPESAVTGLWRTMLHYTPCAIAYRVTKLAARTAADFLQGKTV